MKPAVCAAWSRRPRAYAVPSPTASWAALAFTVPGLRPQPSQPPSIGRVSRSPSSHSNDWLRRSRTAWQMSAAFSATSLPNECNTCNSLGNSLCNTCCYPVIHGRRRSCRNRLCNSVRNTRCDIVFHSDRFPVLLNEAGGLPRLQRTARAHVVPSPTASWAALAFTVPGLKPQPSQALSIGRVSRSAFSHGGAGSSARVWRPVSQRPSPMTRCSAARPHACSAAEPRCGRSTSGCTHCSYRWSAETSCAGASAASLVSGQWRR
jgi:hypothetical protein